MQVTGVRQFDVAEGLDLTGVATNLLSCNVSMAIVIDNKSKVFELNVLSPVVDIYFGRVSLVQSQVSASFLLFIFDYSDDIILLMKRRNYYYLHE